MKIKKMNINKRRIWVHTYDYIFGRKLSKIEQLTTNLQITTKNIEIKSLRG